MRGDFAIHAGKNCIHGYTNAENVSREITLWFKPKELITWDRLIDKLIYE